MCRAAFCGADGPTRLCMARRSRNQHQRGFADARPTGNRGAGPRAGTGKLPAPPRREPAGTVPLGAPARQQVREQVLRRHLDLYANAMRARSPDPLPGGCCEPPHRRSTPPQGRDMSVRAVCMSVLGSYRWALTCFYCGSSIDLEQRLSECQHAIRASLLPSGGYQRVTSMRRTGVLPPWMRDASCDQ